MVLSLFILALLSGSTIGLDNGVARTPPMGWNPYNVFSCDSTEDQYHSAAMALVTSGLRDVGYRYLNMDCGWQATSRTPSGLFTWDVTRIPSGIPALADYVHGLGLLFGLYSDAGYNTCDSSDGQEHRIGSLGHEYSDAQMFHNWGADYLKYDNCYAVSPDDYVDYDPPAGQEENNYERMGEALSQLGINMVFSISDWGVQYPARWAGALGNSWRISNDVDTSFESLKRIINQLVPVTSFARPGSWNDLDLLEVGNEGLTQTEWATQFAFWAAAKSPLLISTDLATISPEALNILNNERIIGVNQDPLGASISFVRRYTDKFDVWAGPLAESDTQVAVLVNWVDAPQTIIFNLSDIHLSSADLTDLWTGTDLGTVDGWTTAAVGAHGALIYKLSNCVPAESHHFVTYLAAASTNVLSGGATNRTLNDGMTVVVGRIGYGGTLAFVGIDGGSNGGTKLLQLAYANADYTFFNTECSNCRRAEVSVNGGTPVEVEMPISGQDWNILFQSYLLSLDGFVPGPNNEVMFANPNAWAPDMYSILVYD